MKKALLYLTGYALLGVGALVGAIANVVALLRDAFTVQALLFAGSFLVLFGICAHLSIVWLLRILKARSINKENK